MTHYRYIEVKVRRPWRLLVAAGFAAGWATRQLLTWADRQAELILREDLKRWASE